MLWTCKRHEFDLVELVLTNQTANVGAVRPRFAAETWRVGRISDRKRAAVENLTSMHVGERHFRRWHQIEIPLAGNLEQIRLEPWQIAGASERRRVRHERRLDFPVSVLFRMKVGHEVNERARETRPGAQQH